MKLLFIFFCLPSQLVNIYMFIKPYKFPIEKKGQRFMYICKPHQVKKKDFRLKKQKGRENLSSRLELQFRMSSKF